MKLKNSVFIIAFAFLGGCAAPDEIKEAARPVAEPIQKTTKEVFKTRKIGGAQSGTAQAILFPDEARKGEQFKIKF